MKKSVATLAVAAALAAPLAVSAPAHAAEGGQQADNPGLVSLVDSEGRHQCTAVLVNESWALTWSDTARCGSSSTVRDASGHTTGVVERRYNVARDGVTHTDPTKSQAMLVRLAQPLAGTRVAQLSTEAPRAGEKLTIAAFNDRAATSVGHSPVTIEGHHGWISWFDAPSAMTLEHSDAGAALLRGDKVVGFLGLAQHDGGDAEDIANVSSWVDSVVHS